MNINIHKANERRFAEIMDTTLNTTRTVWEIMTLKTLHDDFGFGEKRLMQFADALRENYGDNDYGTIYHGKPVFIKTLSPYSNGNEQKVIGEFTCDRIIDVDCDSIAPFDKSTGIYIGKQCCLSREELWKYTSGHCAHGWHISDLKIYNKPKALSEFGLTRPPQPWRYVEVSADEP